MPNSLYNFQYTPLTGRLPGKSFVSQTEQAINGLAQYVYENSTNYEAVKAIAQKAEEDSSSALEYSEQALDKAQTALETVGRAYIKTTSAVDLNDYFNSELLYITNVGSANLPADITGYLTVMSTDSHDYCMQVYICDSGDVYKRSATIADSTPTFGYWSETPITMSVLQPLLNALANANASNIGINADTDNSIAWGNAIGGGEIANDEQRLITGGTVYPLSQSVAQNASNIATNTADIVQNTGGISANNKRITNIEKLLQGNLYDYQTDSTSAYTKSVPSGAMPYAGLEKVGGRTLVANNISVKFAYTGYITNFIANGVTVTTNANPDGSETYTFNGTYTGSNKETSQYYTFLAGHKYILKGCPPNGSADTYYWGIGGSVNDIGEGYYAAFSNNYLSSLRFMVKNGSVFNNAKICLQCIDLTQMFGAGNEPASVAEYNAVIQANFPMGMPSKLLSAGVTEVVSDGYNHFNEEWWQNSGYYTYSDGVYTGNTSYQKLNEGAAYNQNWKPNTAYFLSVDGMTTAGATWNLRWYVEYTDGTTQYSPALLGGVATYETTSITTDPAKTVLKAHLEFFNSWVGNFKNFIMREVSVQTISIPTAIRNLEGYGWSCPDHYNYIDYEAKKYVQEVGSRAYASGDESDSTVITDGTTTYYPLNPAIETDISAYLTDDNLIEVESGGSITFPNSNGDDYRLPVPSAETYMIDLQEAINNG